MFSLFSPVLVEDAEEYVLRRDVGCINCRAFVLKSGSCGFCTPSPWNTQCPGRGTEGSNEAGGTINRNGKVLPVNSLAIPKALFKNKRLAGACDYCGDVQVKNMEVEHLWNILLEGAPYMKKYET